MGGPLAGGCGRAAFAGKDANKCFASVCGSVFEIPRVFFGGDHRLPCQLFTVLLKVVADKAPERLNDLAQRSRKCIARKFKHVRYSPQSFRHKSERIGRRHKRGRCVLQCDAKAVKAR